MLPVAPGGRKYYKDGRRKSAALKGAKVGGRGACGTSSSQESKLQRDLQTKALIPSMTVEGLAVFLLFVMLQTQFPFHCAHWLLPLPPQTTPLFYGQSPKNCCYFYTCLSFLPFFCLFLRSIQMSSPPCTPSFLLFFCRSLLSLFQPNVERGNLTVSLACAAFTPTVCTSQKVKQS